MSHETHHSPSSDTERVKISSGSSFWLIIVLVGLFIGALNFITAMSHGEGEEHGAKTEATSEKKEGGEAAKAEGKEEKKEAAEAPKAEEKPAEAKAEGEKKAEK